MGLRIVRHVRVIRDCFELAGVTGISARGTLGCIDSARQIISAQDVARSVNAAVCVAFVWITYCRMCEWVWFRTVLGFECKRGQDDDWFSTVDSRLGLGCDCAILNGRELPLANCANKSGT